MGSAYRLYCTPIDYLKAVELLFLAITKIIYIGRCDVKRILVTGGASGLGKAIAIRLASSVDNIIYITYKESQESAEALERKYSNITKIKCDYTSEKDIDNLLLLISRHDVDVLINNAITSMHREHFLKIDWRVFVSSFMSNVVPVIKITQGAIKQFRSKRFGKIINILTSALLGAPPPGNAEYIANKAYIEALSRSWATENAKYNITSNCVYPSFMQTRLTSDIDERFVEIIKNEHPLRRILQPDEVADAVAFLTAASQQINGASIVINAGTCIR